MRSTPQRFQALTRKSGDCWLWVGAVSRNKYPMFRDESGYTTTAYRWAFLKVRGEIYGCLKKVCHTERCVNPHHYRDVHRSATNTKYPGEYCRRGHLKEGYNLIEYMQGTTLRVYCRKCHNVNMRRYRVRKRMESE